MINITEKLMLQFIEANAWTHDDRDREITTCWLLHFSFCGYDGFEAYFTDDAVKKEYCDFEMIESGEADLHDSFSDALEENWKRIVELISAWEAENFKAQTAMVRRIENNRREMASLEENILCLYSENPDKGESIILALAEIAEFAEHRTIIEVLTLFRRASEYCDHIEQQLSAPESGPLTLDYYSE